MDNNDFEQDFIKKVKQQPVVPQKTVTETTVRSSMLTLILPIIFAVVVLVESVALVIFAINYGVVLNLYGENYAEHSEEKVDDLPEAHGENNDYSIDDNYNVIAFNLTCEVQDGSRYTFAKSGNYQKYDKTSDTTESGSYSIVNGSAVVLKNSNQSEDTVVFYDGENIIENTTFYVCGT